MRILSINGILFLLLLFHFTNTCLQPTQIDGSCTKCQPTENLENGFCYQKIRGCLIQLAKICNKCQTGYVISNSACIREAQFNNVTILNPPPQVIQSQALKSSDITPVMVGGYQEMTDLSNSLYKTAQKTLFDEYPTLKPLKIYKIEQQIVNGVNILFYIIDLSNYDLYLAKIYVSLSLQGSVKQIYRNDQSIKKGETQAPLISAPVPGKWTTFDNLSDERYNDSKSLLQKNYEGLKNYNLQKVQYQIVAGLNFLFYYTHSKNNQPFSAKVYKPFYGKTKITNTWGLNPNEVSIQATNQIQTNVGGYKLMNPQSYQTNLLFLQAIKVIKSLFPQFDNSWIRKVQQQVASGSNFIVNFAKPSENDVYEIKIYVPLNFNEQLPNIVYLKKNNSLIDLPQNVSQPPLNDMPLSGGFQLIKPEDYNVQVFKRIQKSIQQILPPFNNGWITKVQQQVVAGMNYIINFVDPIAKDTYETLIMVPLNYQIQPLSIRYFKKNGLDVNQNLQTVSNPAQQTTTNTNVLAGGYQLIKPEQYNSQIIQQAKKAVKKVFQFFSDSWIKQIQQQVVSGFNYIFTLSEPNSKDIYQVKVYVPLAYTGLQPEIQYIKKNGQDFTFNTNGNGDNSSIATKIQPPYDWQKDSTFTQLYKFFIKEVNITNLPQISEVQRQLKTQGQLQYWEYKIIYSSLQYAIARYYPVYNVYQVISYIADKTQIYRLVQQYNLGPNDRSQAVLAQRIKNYDPQRFIKVYVKQITQVKLYNYRIYKVDCFTYLGEYQITILDKGELFVVKVVQLSKNTCFPIRINSAIEYRQQSIIDQIKTFLFTKYSLSGFQLTLSQVNSYPNSISQYRLLLSRSDYKKIYVFVEEANDKFVVKRVDILSGGMYLMTQGNATKTLEDLARKDYSQDLNGYEKIITLTNGTFYNIKFANQNNLRAYSRLSQSNTYDLTSQDLIDTKNCDFKKLNSQICEKCPVSDLLWKGKCYTKISNCAIQAGNFCLICDKFSIPSNNKCLKDCQDVFQY